MSADPTAIADYENEKVGVEQDWELQNGTYSTPVELKLENQPVFTMRTPSQQIRAKRKEEGPLEIVCGWIVEHQIGMICP